MIFDPKFEPLWRRVKRLSEEKLEIADLTAACHELASFVKALPMGSFYSARLSELLKKPRARVVWPSSVVEGIGSHHQPVSPAKKTSELDIYRDHIDRVRNEVIRLIVEMLRYQDWR